MDGKYIFVGGYAGSGKSACIDFLKEFKDTRDLGPEIRIITDPDGIISLKTIFENCWTPYQIDMAIKRFMKLIKTLSKTKSSPYYGRNFNKILFDDFGELSQEYAKSLYSFKFKGIWFGIDNFRAAFSRRLQNKFNISLPDFTTDMYIGYPEKDFYTLTKKYIDDIISRTLVYHNCSNAKNIIINEPFASMNADNMLEIINDAKIIIVNRDPRDMYSTGIKNKLRFVPRESVDQFISWYKFMHKRSEKAATNKENILKIDFEDLVGNYKDTKKKIITFLKLTEGDHIDQFKFLDPNKSVKTVGLWKNYPDQKEINKMKVELKDYYDFDRE